MTKTCGYCHGGRTVDSETCRTCDGVGKVRDAQPAGADVTVVVRGRLSSAWIEGGAVALCDQQPIYVPAPYVMSVTSIAVVGGTERMIRTAQAGTLRAYAERWHGTTEGIAQQVDYGTGVEYDEICQCGVSVDEHGCPEAQQLLADADAIENGTPYIDITDIDEPALPSIHDPKNGAGQPNQMIDDDGDAWYPDGPEDAAHFAEHYGARFVGPNPWPPSPS